jgi:hypothetical protein
MIHTAAGSFKVYSDPDCPLDEGRVSREGSPVHPHLEGLPHIIDLDGNPMLCARRRERRRGARRGLLQPHPGRPRRTGRLQRSRPRSRARPPQPNHLHFPAAGLGSAETRKTMSDLNLNALAIRGLPTPIANNVRGPIRSSRYGELMSMPSARSRKPRRTGHVLPRAQRDERRVDDDRRPRGAGPRGRRRHDDQAADPCREQRDGLDGTWRVPRLHRDRGRHGRRDGSAGVLGGAARHRGDPHHDRRARR